MSVSTAARSRFRPASRKQRKLRAGLCGPAGSGKSFTALRWAFALSPSASIAVICADHGAAELYQGELMEDDGTKADFQINVLSDFSPSSYTAAIEDAGAAGFEVVIVDGLTQAWAGAGGALELVNQVAKQSSSKNTYTAWREVTPMHTRLVEALLSTPSHLICTLRAKQAHVLQKDEKGREVPVRIGMQPIQREGMEYEFDLFCDLDVNHVLTVSKTRCRAVDNATVVKPGAAFLRPVIDWLNTGETVASTFVQTRVYDATLQAIVLAVAEAGFGDDRIKKEIIKRYGVTQLSDMREENGKEFLVWLQAQAKRVKKPTSEMTPPAPVATTPPQDPQSQLPQTPKVKNAPAKPDAPASRDAHPRVIRLRELVKTMEGFGLSREVWVQTLNRYGAPSEIDLDDDQLETLIAKLEAKVPRTTAGAGTGATASTASGNGAPGHANGANGNSAPVSTDTSKGGDAQPKEHAAGSAGESD